jgi:hypothetical protein
MTVQARFYVAETTRYAGLGYAEPKPAGKVVMRPVTRGEANSMWASATPSGNIEMVIKSGAYTWFEERLGTEIAITFDDVPAE